MSLKRSSSAFNEKEPHGLLDWFHILRAISDEDLKLICGADCALYLIFNRYATIFFALMTLFNSVILIPIYGTGYPSKPDLLIDPETKETISLLTITVLNASGNIAKMISVYTMILIFYTFGTLAFMFFYWKRCLSWSFKDLP